MIVHYLNLFISVLLLAANFSLRRLYTARAGDTLPASMRYSLYSGLSCCIFFLLIGRGISQPTLFSVFMAAASSVLCLLYTVIGFKIMAEGGLALYMLFLMSGGMAVPYIFGIVFLNEEFSALRSIGFVLILVSLVVVNSGDIKINRKILMMCVAVFVLNGFVSVVSKLHQLSVHAVSENDFVIITNVVTVILSAILMPFTSKGKSSVNIGFGISAAVVLSAIASGVSYLLQLICAKTLPATVLYPTLTGGSIIMSALCGMIFFKERPGKMLIFGIVLCFIGTCMFL